VPPPAAAADAAHRGGASVPTRSQAGSTARTPAGLAGPRRRRARRPQERLGHRPDRVALWALLLGFVLALTAAITADAATRLGDRTLERGMVGRDVRHLQLRLKRLGLLDAPATARFGALTERAVRRYQRSRCLTVDGIAGRGTIRALRTGRRPCRAGATRGGHRTHTTYRRVELGGRTLVRGMAGRDVRTIQHLLGVRSTGSFGPITARAVRSFQRRAGLDADGAVGPATREALARRRMVVRTVTWYGPGLYGRRTACGQRMTRRLVGVAHRRLPCGARVTLHRAGRFVTVPVVDRGPFTRGVSLDLTAAAARGLGLQQTEQLRVAS
jgi:peptidoglycan hydrolase-like protein with peptidoglycan-binding domain